MEKSHEVFGDLKENSQNHKILTLAFIMTNEQVLLGLKKRGLGIGLWNGFGGKVEPGETIPEAASREIKEECGLTVKPEEMEQIAVIDLEFLNDPVIFRMHIFKCTQFTGDIMESEEMKPAWYPINKVPQDQMWGESKIWYPFFVRGIPFKAYFFFEGSTKILSYKVMNWQCDKVLEEMKQIE